MKINETPVKTSKNYGINNFELPDNEIVFNPNSKLNFFVENANNIEQVSNSAVPTKPISSKSLEQLKTPNHSYSAKILKTIESPIILNFSEFETLVSKLHFETIENTSAKIIIVLKEQQKSYSNIFAKFSVAKNSNLSILFLCDTFSNSTNLYNIESTIKENAKIDIKFLDFGSSFSILNYYANILGDNSVSIFKNLYIGSETNSFDINIYQDVFGKNSSITNTTVGALLDNAQKNYKGTINFNKGSKKSVGDESELCLLLSKNAKSKALPMLLCTEEDVDGSHSTAVGKLDDKELFYVMSRGLSKPEAMQLLIKAKFNCILNGIFDENLFNQIVEKIDRKINNDN